ncbi:MAG: hypothetical protein MUE36_06045 [Acidimicrobiales bacterium]|jgi:hypothetical protein|nr:hypothetical protein [Acidimicrobiales bacterium]
MRRVEHRKVRHLAHVQLHQAAHGLDLDELVVAEAIRRHGYDDAVSEPEAIGPKRIKHWKTPFWKRRNVLRAQRWQLALADLD